MKLLRFSTAIQFGTKPLQILQLTDGHPYKLRVEGDRLIIQAGNEISDCPIAWVQAYGFTLDSLRPKTK